MRIVAYRASSRGSRAYGISRLEALEELRRDLGRAQKPFVVHEVTIEPIVTNPEPHLIEVNYVRNPVPRS